MAEKSKSKKVQSPNQGSNKGFLIAVIAIIAVAAVFFCYLIWQGNKSDDEAQGFDREEIKASVSVVKNNAIELRGEAATDSTPVVDLFEDFSCHVCSDLNASDHDRMKDKIEAGQLVVRFHPLNFLNDGFNGGSNRGASAALVAAKSGDASLYWSLRNYALAHFSEISGQWEYADYADAAKSMGADDEVAKTIEEGSDEDELAAMAEANAEELQDRLGTVSSPHVFKGDEQLEINRTDMGDWVDRAVSQE